MFDHYVKIARDHLDQLDDYEDWMAEQALHAWVGDVVRVAVEDGDEKLADRLRLDGLVTEKAAVREAFEERLKLLERKS